MSTIKDRIRALAKDKGLSLTKLEKELGFGNGTICKWGSGGASPNTAKLEAVANYLGVSSEYLLHGNKNQHIELVLSDEWLSEPRQLEMPTQEREHYDEFIRLFNQLDTTDKAMVKAYVQGILDKRGL